MHNYAQKWEKYQYLPGNVDRVRGNGVICIKTAYIFILLGYFWVFIHEKAN